MIEIWDGQTDLRPLAESWLDECPGDYDIEKGLRDLQDMNELSNSDVFILKNDIVVDGIIYGAMGITVLDMFFTKEIYSAVRYWYILPNYRYLAPELIAFAEKWSKEMGCTKMMICSNKLSLPCDDFYKKIGYREFETVYIGDL
jgi:hypothetical protein